MSLESASWLVLPSDTLVGSDPATTSAVAVAELDLRCVAFVAGGLITFCDEKDGGEECDVYLGLKHSSSDTFVGFYQQQQHVLLLNPSYKFAYVAGGLSTVTEEGGWQKCVFCLGSWRISGRLLVALPSLRATSLLVESFFFFRHSRTDRSSSFST